jgi:hypothetical protein
MIKKIFRKIFGRKEIQINKWEFNNLSGFPIKIYLNACLSDTTLNEHLSENIVFGGYNFIGEYTRIFAKAKFGLGTTIGSFNWMEGEVEIGNYTQLGPKVNIISSNHFMSSITPYNSNFLFDGRLKKNTQARQSCYWK